MDEYVVQSYTQGNEEQNDVVQEWGKWYGGGNMPQFELLSKTIKFLTDLVYFIVLSGFPSPLMVDSELTDSTVPFSCLQLAVSSSCLQTRRDLRPALLQIGPYAQWAACIDGQRNVKGR